MLKRTISIAAIVGLAAAIMLGCSNSAKAQCSSAEQQVIRLALENIYQASYAAGFYGDFSRLIPTLAAEEQRLENNLSEGCQNAFNQAIQIQIGGGGGGGWGGGGGNVMDHGGGTYSMGNVSCSPSGCLGL